ncbi:MAG: SpoIIE family protein phosphatase, partial [Bacteroidetes bacterium]|nr:SpoIIE family protein phosphatase [Bacteroidota bacterium]
MAKKGFSHEGRNENYLTTMSLSEANIHSASQLISELESGLANYDLFKDFTHEQVRKILQSSTIKQIDPGEVLIESNQSNDTLYLLITGELRIILEKGDTEISIPIHEGECLGEMSIVMERPTSAMVIGHETSQILCIPDYVFWEQIMIRKGVRNMMSMMASRLQRTNHALIREVEEQIKYKHLEKELETAGKIQASMVPNGSELLPNHPEIDAFAMSKQAREVGGDFYDALALDDERIYIAIGDVSGKGMPAALFMMRTFTSLRMLISNNPNFDEVMPSVNDLLARNNEDMMFVSIFAGVLNIRTGLLQYVNGGHNPPFVSLEGGVYYALDVNKSPLVGIMENARFEVGEIQLQPGDSLLLYTDGITEAMNSQSLMFDMERTQSVLNGRQYESMKEMVQALEEAIEAFVGEAPQHDDFTIMGLR